MRKCIKLFNNKNILINFRFYLCNKGKKSKNILLNIDQQLASYMFIELFKKKTFYMILLKPIRLDKKIYQFYYGHVILLNTIHTLKSPRRPFKGFWSQRKVLIVLFKNYYPLFLAADFIRDGSMDFPKKLRVKIPRAGFF